MAKRVCEILPIGQEKVDAYKWYATSEVMP